MRHFSPVMCVNTRYSIASRFTLETDLLLMSRHCEYLPGSASLPTSPATPVAPSMAVGGRLARSASASQPETGKAQARLEAQG